MNTLNDTIRALNEAESRLRWAIDNQTSLAAEAYELISDAEGDQKVAGLVRLIEDVVALALRIEEGDYNTARIRISRPASVSHNGYRTRWFVTYYEVRTRTQLVAGDDGRRQHGFPTSEAALAFVNSKLEVVGE